jgi:hypothetical protein
MQNILNLKILRNTTRYEAPDTIVRNFEGNFSKIHFFLVRLRRIFSALIQITVNPTMHPLWHWKFFTAYREFYFFLALGPLQTELPFLSKLNFAVNYLVARRPGNEGALADWPKFTRVYSHTHQVDLTTFESDDHRFTRLSLEFYPLVFACRAMSSLDSSSGSFHCVFETGELETVCWESYNVGAIIHEMQLEKASVW